VSMSEAALAFDKVKSGTTFSTRLFQKSFRFWRHFEKTIEVASARWDAILSIISPAFPRTSISIRKNDESVYGSGHTR
jgi:hypothetical protein